MSTLSSLFHSWAFVPSFVPSFFPSFFFLSSFFPPLIKGRRRGPTHCGMTGMMHPRENSTISSAIVSSLSPADKRSAPRFFREEMVPGEPGEPGSQGRAGTRPKGVWELRGGDERCSAEHQREREETVKQSERNDLRMRKASKGNATLDEKDNQVLDEADPTSIICRRPGNTSKGGSRASSIPPAEIGCFLWFPVPFFFFFSRDISKKLLLQRPLKERGPDLCCTQTGQLC
jgi:hypothetical protein